MRSDVKCELEKLQDQKSKARAGSKISYMEPIPIMAREVPRDERIFTNHGLAPRGYMPSPFQG